jgi:hypothetical protein
MTLKPRVSCGVFVAVLLLGSHTMATSQNGDDDAVFSPVLAAMNDWLRDAGVTHIAIDRAELLFQLTGSGDQKSTILASSRTHLLDAQFVENDPRRGGSPDLSYLVDQSDGAALGFNNLGQVIALANAVTEPQLDASVAAWNGPGCNGPGFVKVADNGADPDLADGILLNNAALVGTPFVDVTFGGWLPSGFFNLVLPNGATSVLAVTFTFIFLDNQGNPTDLDRDRRADTAFREIFFNRGFPWGTGGNPANVDIQTAAIHEFGHALGLEHFGKIFVTTQGALQFAPKAIMNPGYTGEDRRIRGTDNASFCHVWANGH